MANAYYDQKLAPADAKKLLTSLEAKHLPKRDQPGIMVYKLKGDGEAMVERAGTSLRVRLFNGKCAC